MLTPDAALKDRGTGTVRALGVGEDDGMLPAAFAPPAKTVPIAAVRPAAAACLPCANNPAAFARSC